MSKRRIASGSNGKKNLPVGAILLGIIAIGIIAAGYIMGLQLPMLLQRLAAVGFALFTVIICFVATSKREESVDEMMARYKQNPQQAAEFGRQARMREAQPKTINLPGLGETKVRTLTATTLFVVMLVWWLTPFAPIAVAEQDVEDMINPLREQVLAGVLIMADDRVAVLQPPSVPESIRTAATVIDDDAQPMQLGVRAIAEGQFNQAAALFESQIGSADDNDVRTLQALNSIYAGRASSAIDPLEKALQAKPDDINLLCLRIIAGLYAGQKDEAWKAHNEKLDKLTESLLPTDPSSAWAAHIKALVLTDEGTDREKAISLFSQVADQTTGKEESKILSAAATNNQGIFYLFKGNYSGASGQIDEADRIWHTLHGPKHPLARVGEGNRAMLEMIQGKSKDALERLVKESDPSLLTAEKPEIALADVNAINQLAVALLAAGRIEEAEKWNAITIELLETTGYSNPAAVSSLITTGRILKAKSLNRRAESVLREAVTQGDRAWGRNHPYMIPLLCEIASLYIDLGQEDKAKPHVDRAIKIATEIYSEKHPWLVDTMIPQARLTLKESTKKTRDLLTEATRLVDESFDDTHPIMIDINKFMGSTYTSSSRRADAFRAYNDAISLIESNYGGNPAAVADLCYQMAKLEARRSQFEEARDQLLRSLELLDANNLLDPEADPIGEDSPLPSSAKLKIDLLMALAKMTEAIEPAGDETTAKVEMLRTRAAAIQQKLDAADVVTE